jgi:hypothetical protein
MEDDMPNAGYRNSDAQIDQWVRNDMAAAEKLANAIRAAKEAISGLTFELGSPVRGYDWDDVMSLLDDLMPPLPFELMAQLETRAIERMTEETL